MSGPGHIRRREVKLGCPESTASVDILEVRCHRKVFAANSVDTRAWLGQWIPGFPSRNLFLQTVTGADEAAWAALLGWFCFRLFDFVTFVCASSARSLITLILFRSLPIKVFYVPQGCWYIHIQAASLPANQPTSLPSGQVHRRLRHGILLRPENLWVVHSASTSAALFSPWPMHEREAASLKDACYDMPSISKPLLRPRSDSSKTRRFLLTW